jgi:hypothetical protein
MVEKYKYNVTYTTFFMILSGAEAKATLPAFGPTEGHN